ncbi:MAG: trypsin-like peptidase domain-containing protein, partial [Lachnospiraceae bacterium]|nr:trypsin-like peptidase domain-containing protein [Lachnospiraceae bacterium]
FALNVAGVINPYDSGYIEESNMDAAIDNIKHAVVRIHYETPRTRTFGSGYIVKITDKEIICATNNHVVTDRNYVTVSFYDGTNVEARVVAGKVSPDIAFISINRSDIKDFDNLDLKTIHINRGYYESLSSKPQFEMGMYCINENGSQWLERTGKIVRKSGKLDKYFENYDYAVTQISVRLTPGVSGSAIIDSHANLLCMAAFYWVHDGNTEYYGVSVTDILDYYKEVFGQRLEYY